MGESVPHRQSYIAPRILCKVEASMIRVLAHVFLCAFLCFRFKCTGRVELLSSAAPPDLSPLCSLPSVKQHSILFPSPAILLPYVVHLPPLQLLPPSLPPWFWFWAPFSLLSAFFCALALSNTTPVPTKMDSPLKWSFYDPAVSPLSEQLRKWTPPGFLWHHFSCFNGVYWRHAHSFY